MQHKVWLAVSLVGLTLAAGCGGDDAGTPAAEGTTATEEMTTTEHEAGEPVEVALSEVDDSGVSGTAMLSESGGEGPPKVTVELSVEPPGEQSRPAHIHNVTCAEYTKIEDTDAQAKTVVDMLSNVGQGTSTSTFPGELSQRTTGEYSINVHSSAIPFPAIACGDIPAHE